MVVALRSRVLAALLCLLFFNCTLVYFLLNNRFNVLRVRFESIGLKISDFFVLFHYLQRLIRTLA